MDNSFDLDKITLNQQQYIETIYSLCKKEKHKHAHAKDIAEHLNIKMPSVTEALRNLQSLGLINYEVRKAVTLTDKGEFAGQELFKRHQVFSEFFSDILGIEKVRADNIACKIEHVIDKEIRETFSSFIECLKTNVLSKKDNFIEKFQSGIINSGSNKLK